MLFPTITFAVFFLLVFVGNWLLMPRQRVWKPFMLVVSLVFYGWWDCPLTPAAEPPDPRGADPPGGALRPSRAAGVASATSRRGRLRGPRAPG